MMRKRSSTPSSEVSKELPKQTKEGLQEREMEEQADDDQNSEASLCLNYMHLGPVSQFKKFAISLREKYNKRKPLWTV